MNRQAETAGRAAQLQAGTVARRPNGGPSNSSAPNGGTLPGGPLNGSAPNDGALNDNSLGGTPNNSTLKGGRVFLCSGQGSQKPGMGKTALGVPELADTFRCASEVLGTKLAGIACSDDPALLADTRNAQAVLAAFSIGFARALSERGHTPHAVLGFSLGQISALAISGMLSVEGTFSLISKRAELMHEAALARPGAMSALLRAGADEVQALCDACAEGQIVVPANFNCPGQIVVSGDRAAVERVEQHWEASGKRFSRLATEGAFHSPLMAEAARALDAYLEHLSFSDPQIPLICNTDALPLSAAHAREHLVKHLTGPVCFDESVRFAQNAGAGEFVEVGFGGVLIGLVRRIDKSAQRFCVQDEESLAAYLSNAGNAQTANASAVRTSETNTSAISAKAAASNSDNTQTVQTGAANTSTTSTKEN